MLCSIRYSFSHLLMKSFSQPTEVTLAKSESVFYYHPVRHLDGSIRPLSEPRASNDENGEEHHFSDHFPFMKRFEDDWSFLGKMQGSPNDVPPPPPPPVTESKMPERPNDIPPPVTEIVVPGDSRKKQSHSKTQPTIKSTHHVHKKVENPYKRSRKATMDKYQPALQEISPNIPATNPFSVFAKMDDIKPALATGTLKYLQKQEDVRFVKRRFSPDKDNTRFNKNSKMPIQKRNFSSHRQVFGEYARDHQEKLNSNKTLQSACSQEISHAENGGFDAACQFEYDVPDETNIVSSRRTTVGKTDNDWLSDRITYSESPLRGVPLPTESLRQENTECFDLTGSDSGHAGLCERGNVEVLLEYTESAIHSNEAEGFGERLHPTDRKSEYNFESFDSSQQDFDTEPKPTHTKKTSVEVYSDSEKGTECNLEHYEWSRPDLDIDPQQTLRSERSLIGLGTKTDRVIEFEPRSYVPSQNNIGIDPKQINTEKQGEHNPRYYDSLRPDLCIDPNQKQTSGFSTDFSHGARSATERYSEYNPECYDSSRPNLENDPKLTVTSELSEIAFGTRSKHFKNDRSRRVTLDPTEIDDASLGDGQSGPTSFKAIYQSGLGRDKVDTVTPQAKRSDLNDEIIESPLDFDDHPASASFFKEPLGKRLSGQFSIAGDRYSSVASHKPRRGGPLENAFKRQEQLSSQDSSSRSWRNSSIVRSSNGSLLGGKKKVNSLTSYFQPVKKKRAVFSQLHIDTGENDEDFLWNTL